MLNQILDTPSAQVNQILDIPSAQISSLPFFFSLSQGHNQCTKAHNKK